MARKVEVRLIDDLDSTTAAETVTFALDGVAYEIDLSAKHASELRGGLDKFVQVAQRVSRGRTGVARSVVARRSASVANTEQNQAIRAWAIGKGMAVAARGRIPQVIVEQYQAKAGRPDANGKRRRG